MSNDALPPLPEAERLTIRGQDGFSAEQMRDYARAAIRALSADRGEAVWSYCPECGSDELHHAEGVHKQCKRCKQEWFSDVDYTRAVRANLGVWMDRKEATPPSPAESAEGDAAPSQVSDAMVERALSAKLGAHSEVRHFLKHPDQHAANSKWPAAIIRAALEAAQPQPGRVEGMDALIAADKEYDDALVNLTTINREIAENGWVALEADALRQAGTRFVRARCRRDEALAKVQP